MLLDDDGSDGDERPLKRKNGGRGYKSKKDGMLGQVLTLVSVSLSRKDCSEVIAKTFQSMNLSLQMVSELIVKIDSTLENKTPELNAEILNLQLAQQQWDKVYRKEPSLR